MFMSCGSITVWMDIFFIFLRQRVAQVYQRNPFNEKVPREDK
jgi:hypothetical protein